jgi:hypothetical protein
MVLALFKQLLLMITQFAHNKPLKRIQQPSGEQDIAFFACEDYSNLVTITKSFTGSKSAHINAQDCS